MLGTLLGRDYQTLNFNIMTYKGMEKKESPGSFSWKKGLSRTWGLLLLLLCSMTLQANARLSPQKVTIQVTNATLQEVIRQIEQQTELGFMYDAKDIADVTGLNLNFRDADVETVLDAALRGTSLTYTIESETILITRRVQQAVTEVPEVWELKGKVMDRDSLPLPGVTVMLKGTTVGVVTDAKGEFTLQVPAVDGGVTLRFSFVGMKTHEVKCSGNRTLKVVLQEEAELVDEVVVTGYQVIDRRKSTSAITSVKAEDIIRPGVSTIDQLLEGQIPDLFFMTNSGEVGVAPKLRIRGTSTLIGNREPLWVIDGIIQQDPVNISPEELNDPDFVNRIGNAISGLNPNDIDRIDVLKDASATALYGTRAANGVIVITTKKGHIGEPIITYSMTGTLKLRPRYSDRKIDLMDSRERVNFSRELMEQKYTFPSNMALIGYEYLFARLYNKEISYAELEKEISAMETRNTDWFDILCDDAFSHAHTLSVSGGSKDIRYYMSVGYTGDNDVIPFNENKRYTAAANLNMIFGEHLTAYFSLNANKTSREYYQEEIAPINYAYNTSRAIPLRNEDGSLYYYKLYIGRFDNFQYVDYNIWNELQNSGTKQDGSGITMNANIMYTPFSWLRVNGTASYSISNTDMESYWGAATKHAALMRLSEYGDDTKQPDETVMPSGGELAKSFTRSESWTLRLQMDLNHNFGEDKQHFINASVGFEAYSSKYKGYSRTDRGYDPDRGFQFIVHQLGKYEKYDDWLVSTKPAITNELSNTLSVYATVSYSYEDWLTLNVNGRYDGSNKFGSQSNDKILPIWSASFSYNPLEQFDALGFFDYLQFKFSYGYQGNMLDDQSPELIIRKLPLNDYFNANVAEVDVYPNPDLKWERTNSLNAGLEFSAFQRRVMVATDFYYKKTKDAFQARNISRVNGMASYVVNSGEITNKGFSVSLTVSPVYTDKVRWMMSTYYSNASNKVDSQSATDAYNLNNFLSGTVITQDEAVNTFYSYKFMGLNPEDGGPMFDDGEDRVEELAGKTMQEVYSNVLVPSGKREPTMTGGLNNTINLKNIRINFNLAYSFGAKTRLFKVYGGDVDNFSSDKNINRIFLDRWQRPGDEEFTNVPAIMSTDSDAYRKYNKHWSTSSSYEVPTIANTYWEMYNYSDIRVVNANYLKCTNFSFTYMFPYDLISKWGLERLDLSFSAGNPFTITSSGLKGQTPIQGGFTDIQLSERPTFSFGINVAF